MQKSVSAFCLFSTGDSSNNEGWWWCFICADMFEVPPASLTMELHCLHTATSAWIPPSVFHLCRLKCFHRSDFPLVLETRGYSNSHVSTMLMRRWSFPWPFKQLWHFMKCFPEITEYTGTDNCSSGCNPAASLCGWRDVKIQWLTETALCSWQELASCCWLLCPELTARYLLVIGGDLCRGADHYAFGVICHARIDSITPMMKSLHTHTHKKKMK